MRTLTCLLLVLFMSTNIANGALATAQSDLQQALKDRNVAAVSAALDAGADPNHRGEFGRTPLHVAARESSAAVELLLARGAQTDLVDDDGRTALHLSDADSAAILLRHEASFLVLDKQGNSALHTAAESDARMCQLLVEAGLPADVRNNFGVTPLHFAALQGNRNAAEYLLSKGAVVDARTLAAFSYKWSYVAPDVLGMEELVPAGSTPLSIARQKHRSSKWNTSRYDEFAQLLIAHGAKEQRAVAMAPWLALASPIVLIGFLWGILHLDARMRGWDDLAELYAAPTAAVPHLHRGQDGSVGRVGTVQTRRMLRVAVDDAGLFIAMPAWVFAAHPPLLIPWSQLRVESTRTGIAGERVIELRVANSTKGWIILRGGVAGQVLARIRQ